MDGNPFPSTLRSYVSSRVFNFSYKFSSEALNHRCGRRGAKVWTAGGQVWTDCYSSTNFQAKPSKQKHLGVDGIPFPATLRSRVSFIISSALGFIIIVLHLQILGQNLLQSDSDWRRFVLIFVLPTNQAIPLSGRVPSTMLKRRFLSPSPPLMTLKNFNSLNGMRPVHFSVSQQNISNGSI